MRRFNCRAFLWCCGTLKLEDTVFGVHQHNIHLCVILEPIRQMGFFAAVWHHAIRVLGKVLPLQRCQERSQRGNNWSNRVRRRLQTTFRASKFCRPTRCTRVQEFVSVRELFMRKLNQVGCRQNRSSLMPARSSNHSWTPCHDWRNWLLLMHRS